MHVCVRVTTCACMCVSVCVTAHVRAVCTPLCIGDHESVRVVDTISAEGGCPAPRLSMLTSSSLSPTCEQSVEPRPASPPSPACPSLCSQAKPDPAAEGQVKQPPGPRKDLPAGEEGAAPGSQASTSSSAHLSTAAHASPSGPGKALGVSLNATSGKSQSQSSATPSSESQGQLPSSSGRGKAQGQRRARVSSQRSQQCTQLPGTSSGPSQSALPSSRPLQPPNVTSSPVSPVVQSPSSSNVPTQPPSKPPGEPEDTAPKTSGQRQKQSSKQLASSTSVPELVPCHSGTSLEYTSESTTEITCSWPHHRPPCLQHYWCLKHLAC